MLLSLGRLRPLISAAALIEMSSSLVAQTMARMARLPRRVSHHSAGMWYAAGMSGRDHIHSQSCCTPSYTSRRRSSSGMSPSASTYFPQFLRPGRRGAILDGVGEEERGCERGEG